MSSPRGRTAGWASRQTFLKGSLDHSEVRFQGAAERLIFPYRNTAKESLLIPANEYAEQYPLTWAYLLENRSRLTRRAKGTLGTVWHGSVYKKNHLRFEQPKILAPAVAPGACFAWDEAGSYYFVGSGGGGGGGYGIVLLAVVLLVTAVLARPVELVPRHVLAQTDK